MDGGGAQNPGSPGSPSNPPASADGAQAAFRSRPGEAGRGRLGKTPKANKMESEGRTTSPGGHQGFGGSRSPPCAPLMSLGESLPCSPRRPSLPAGAAHAQCGAREAAAAAPQVRCPDAGPGGCRSALGVALPPNPQLPGGGHRRFCGSRRRGPGRLDPRSLPLSERAAARRAPSPQPRPSGRARRGAGAGSLGARRSEQPRRRAPRDSRAGKNANLLPGISRKRGRRGGDVRAAGRPGRACSAGRPRRPRPSALSAPPPPREK